MFALCVRFDRIVWTLLLFLLINLFSLWNNVNCKYQVGKQKRSFTVSADIPFQKQRKQNKRKTLMVDNSIKRRSRVTYLNRYTFNVILQNDCHLTISRHLLKQRVSFKRQTVTYSRSSLGRIQNQNRKIPRQTNKTFYWKQFSEVCYLLFMCYFFSQIQFIVLTPFLCFSVIFILSNRWHGQRFS